jgi:hypothetical protein
MPPPSHTAMNSRLAFANSNGSTGQMLGHLCCGKVVGGLQRNTVLQAVALVVTVSAPIFRNPPPPEFPFPVSDSACPRRPLRVAQ